MAIKSVEQHELPVALQTMHKFVTEDWNTFRYPIYDALNHTLNHYAQTLNYDYWIESEHKSWLPIYVTGINTSSYSYHQTGLIKLVNTNTIDEFYCLKQISTLSIDCYSVFYVKADQFKKLKPLTYKRFIDSIKNERTN